MMPKNSPIRSIVVSDDIFSDGGHYDAAVEDYVRLLGELHVLLAARADAAVECAFGIARFWKGDAARIFPTAKAVGGAI